MSSGPKAPNPHYERTRPAAGNLLLETDTSLIAVTAEFLPDNSYPLLFHFDNLLRCTKVVGSDEYMKFHLRQYQDGRLKRPADAAYFDELRRGIRYWNGTELQSHARLIR